MDRSIAPGARGRPHSLTRSRGRAAREAAQALLHWPLCAARLRGVRRYKRTYPRAAAGAAGSGLPCRRRRRRAAADALTSGTQAMQAAPQGMGRTAGMRHVPTVQCHRRPSRRSAALRLNVGPCSAAQRTPQPCADRLTHSAVMPTVNRCMQRILSETGWLLSAPTVSLLAHLAEAV